MSQIYYNQGADLFTYIVDPAVFEIKDGYIEALSGMWWTYSVSRRELTIVNRTWTWRRDKRGTRPRDRHPVRPRECLEK